MATKKERKICFIYGDKRLAYCSLYRFLCGSQFTGMVIQGDSVSSLMVQSTFIITRNMKNTRIYYRRTSWIYFIYEISIDNGEVTLSVILGN